MLSESEKHFNSTAIAFKDRFTIYLSASKDADKGGEGERDLMR